MAAATTLSDLGWPVPAVRLLARMGSSDLEVFTAYGADDRQSVANWVTAILKTSAEVSLPAVHAVLEATFAAAWAAATSPPGFHRALHTACRGGRLDTITAMLDEVRAWNATVPAATLHSVLQDCKLSDDAADAVVRRLLAAGASVHATGQFGAQPLHLACQYGLLACIRTLLANGARVEDRTEFGHTPLRCALDAFIPDDVSLAVGRLLVAAEQPSFSEDTHRAGPRSLLHCACFHAKLRCLKWLLLLGVSVDEPKASPLVRVAACSPWPADDPRRLRVVKHLASIGASRDTWWRLDTSPVMDAVHAANVACAAWLAQQGAVLPAGGVWVTRWPADRAERLAYHTAAAVVHCGLSPAAVTRLLPTSDTDATLTAAEAAVVPLVRLCLHHHRRVCQWQHGRQFVDTPWFPKRTCDADEVLRMVHTLVQAMPACRSAVLHTLSAVQALVSPAPFGHALPNDTSSDTCGRLRRLCAVLTARRVGRLRSPDVWQLVEPMGRDVVLFL